MCLLPVKRSGYLTDNPNHETHAYLILTHLCQKFKQEKNNYTTLVVDLLIIFILLNLANVKSNTIDLFGYDNNNKSYNIEISFFLLNKYLLKKKNVVLRNITNEND